MSILDVHSFIAGGLFILGWNFFEQRRWLLAGATVFTAAFVVLFPPAFDWITAA